MFRRVRGLIDHGHQTLGNADATMQRLEALITALIGDLQDGFGVTVHLEPHALAKLYKAITNEEGADLPLVIKVDPAVDTQK